MRHVNRNKRVCKVLIDNEWVKTDMIKLKSGDYFILIEPDNTSVNFDGVDIFLASSDAFINDSGIATVEVKKNIEGIE